MKKTIAMLMAVCMFNFTIQAGITPPIKANEKELSDKFQDLNKLENYVNQNEGVTLSSMTAAGNSEMLSFANIDIAKSSSHEYPLNKGDYSWEDNKAKYIIVGALLVVIIGLFILTDGEGFSSR